jgi:DNA polymerase III subunit alpha
MNFSNKHFVHFHCHSDRSRFDGLIKLSDLIMTARQMGFPALGLTDHGNVMGWMKFLKECRMTKNKKGEDIEYPPIKPILGSEMYLSNKMDIGQYSGKKHAAKTNQPEGRKGNKHLCLYAMNFKGYQNLCTLSQKSWLEGFYSDPRIDFDALSKYSEGLMGSSACLSSFINYNLYTENYDEAKRIAALLKDIFNDNFFLEIMYTGVLEQKIIIPEIFKLSKDLDIPVVATNDVHYLKKEDAMSQEVLMCMSTNRCIKDPKHLHHEYSEYYLKSAEEMAKIFGNNLECLYNSVKMADRINTDDIEKNLFGGMRLPNFEIPKEYKSSYDYMEKKAWDGLKKIGWDKSEDHVNALKMELADVKVAKDNNNYDFAKYFLIVEDYINEARRLGALVACGRGSGYASVLLRCLGITYGVDPIEHSLIWERFLGFSDLRFIKPSDFGFSDEKNIEVDEDLQNDRELEDDLGGIDRY